MPTSDTAQIAAIIREKSDRFEALFRAADAVGLINEYYVSDDLEPVFSAPDAPLLRGRESITAAFEALIAQFSDCKLEQVLIHRSGDMANELGRCDLTTVDGAAATGRYSILWVFTGEGWRVQSDFFAVGDLR